MADHEYGIETTFVDDSTSAVALAPMCVSIGFACCRNRCATAEHICGIGRSRSEGPATKLIGRIDEAAGRAVPRVGRQGENGAQGVLERIETAGVFGHLQLIDHVSVHVNPEFGIERDESPIERAMVQGAQGDAVVGVVGAVRVRGRQDMRAIEKS